MQVNIDIFIRKEFYSISKVNLKLCIILMRLLHLTMFVFSPQIEKSARIYGGGIPFLHSRKVQHIFTRSITHWVYGRYTMDMITQKQYNNFDGTLTKHSKRANCN